VSKASNGSVLAPLKHADERMSVLGVDRQAFHALKNPEIDA